jgi:ribonuclease PH
MRSYERGSGDTRPIEFTPGFTENADGSVLVCFGRTKVICTAFLEDKVPPFLRNTKRGWVTGEYGMLPGSTNTRMNREAARGKQQGRTVEISRLIGRSLRACVDDSLLDENTVTVDCDVIQADGGTRTAAITGGYVALVLCLWKHRELFETWPLTGGVAAVSLGVKDGEVLVDLDYEEDSSADVDMNLVMDHKGNFIEVQGTAEGVPFSRDDMTAMLDQGAAALTTIRDIQRDLLQSQGITQEYMP